MALQLTEQQRQMVDGQAGRPIEVVDPNSQRTYMLIAREQFEKVRSLLDDSQVAAVRPDDVIPEIPAGILHSQEIFWRDLPQLLERRRWRNKWVCYHGDERIGIASTKTELVQRCLKRGLERTEFYVGRIKERPTPPWEPTVLEESLFEVMGETEPSTIP